MVCVDADKGMAVRRLVLLCLLTMLLPVVGAVTQPAAAATAGSLRVAPAPAAVKEQVEVHGSGAAAQVAPGGAAAQDRHPLGHGHHGAYHRDPGGSASQPLLATGSPGRRTGSTRASSARRATGTAPSPPRDGG